jgi:tetratricopeptide (TPR) repeat protein
MRGHTNSIACFRLLALLLAAFGIAAVGGCSKPTQSDPTTPAETPAPTIKAATSEQTQYGNELLQNVIGVLQTPEQFDDEQEAARQIIQRLNQWGRLLRESAAAEGKTLPEFKVDPLFDTLPKTVRDQWSQRLTSDVYDMAHDPIFLREAIMFRDLQAQIRPGKLDSLSVAEALFDWTARNIQIEPQPLEDATPEERWPSLHVPLETVYLGSGTAISRAWAFILLARQAGLDVVMLATPEPKNPSQLRPWLPALVDGDNLYLFDATYGLPIPGPKRQGIATLAQAASDESVLRQMDIPGDRPYPKKSGDLTKVVALIEASPGYLSKRMKLLESHLVGRNRLALSTAPSTLADKLRSMKSISDVKLWAQPYDILAQRAALPPELQRIAALERVPFSIFAEPERGKIPQQRDPEKPEHQVLPLRIGRLLQLRGFMGGTESQQPAAERSGELSALAERGAKFFYLRAIPTQEQLAQVAQMARDRREIVPGRIVTKEFSDGYQRMRDDAVFWLGTVSFQQGAYQTAIQYFGPMTLEAYPDGPWTSAARYNLARCYEALGKYPEAIKLYQADKSPQRFGNQLRALELKQKPSAK